MKKVFFIMIAVLLSFLLVSPAFAQDVCPSDGNWQKIEWDDNDKSVTHTVPDGYIAVGACIKGSQNTEYFTSDGSNANACWSVSGLGTRSVTISENWDGDDKGPECSDISHSSIEIGEEEPTPTPTDEPTETPTDEPTPTTTPTPPGDDDEDIPEVETEPDYGGMSPLVYVIPVVVAGAASYFFLRKKKN